jgi:hypothetical protein
MVMWEYRMRRSLCLQLGTQGRKADRQPWERFLVSPNFRDFNSLKSATSCLVIGLLANETRVA